jgi:hypothetical protein
MALVGSSILLWVYVVMRFSLSLLFIIVAIRLSDRSIQKTLRAARAHWSPVYENYVPQPHLGENYWRTPTPNMPEVHRRGRQSIYIATGMILAFILGIASHELYLLSAGSHLDHALVEKQISSKEFIFNDPSTGIVHGIFCQDVPIKEGMKVSVRFVAYPNCWSVRESGLSYFVEGDLKNGRRNSNANTYANPNAFAFANPYSASR